MKGQLTALDACHELTRQRRIQRVTFDEHPQHRPISHRHGEDGAIILSQEGIAAHCRSQFSRFKGIPDGNRQRALRRFGRIGVARDLSPRETRLNP